MREIRISSSQDSMRRSILVRIQDASRIAGIFFLLVLGIPVLAACSKPQGAIETTIQPAPSSDVNEPVPPANGAFLSRIWISTTPGSSRGSIIVFLPNHTLLLASCFEPFRLSEWGSSGESIRWIEDAIPIQAEVSMHGKDALHLKIAGMEQTRSYVAAEVPYACPDRPG